MRAAWASAASRQLRASATPVRCPRPVIVADDGVGFAVAECDVVDGHSGIPPESGWISIGRMELAMAAVVGF
jgi:hypothetical protein